MISDVLFEARESIREYLENPATTACYADTSLRNQIEHCLETMELLQMRLDMPPPMKGAPDD